MSDKNYTVSETTLKARQEEDKIFTRLFRCSNCKDSHSMEETQEVTE